MADQTREARAHVREILDRFLMGYKTDEDGDFYVHTGVDMPGWVKIIQDGDMIRIFTYLEFRRGERTDARAADRLVNELNTKLGLISIHHAAGRLYSDFFFSAAGGFDDNQFMIMLRESLKIFKNGVREFDGGKLVALM